MAREFIIKIADEILEEEFDEPKPPELVRCKDCIHYRHYGLDSYPVSECKIDHEENPDENWFYADGELEK